MNSPRRFAFRRSGSVLLRHAVTGLLVFAAALALLQPASQAQEAPAEAAGKVEPESAGSEYKDAGEARQLELLRQLLGVEAPKPVVPAAVEAEHEPPRAKPAVSPPTRPAVAPAGPQPARKPTPAARPAPQPKPQPVPAPRPKPAAPKPAPAPTPAPEEAAGDGVLEAGTGGEENAAPGRIPSSVYDTLQISSTDLPPIGAIIDSGNVDRWADLISPSTRWAIRRGARIEMGESKPMPYELTRREATERYHAQVSLSEDRRTMVNYVAGLPFPMVTVDDPDVATKVMFNAVRRIVIDDLDARNFECVGANLDPVEGMVVDRDVRIEHFRRLHYIGRMHVEPFPEYTEVREIDYRESLGPITAPFDLKGAGFSYIRYADHSRLDDSWLYYPLTRKVRRLSTAQRSEGIFGTDIDLDSYGGFAANPAWFEFELLGKKTMLASFHPRHNPARWAPKPADFYFDDRWEAREIHIVAARSLLPGYNFSVRIIYVDVQGHVIPYTEVYDHNGQLWRGYVQQFNAGLRKPVEWATRSVYDFDTTFLLSATTYDMQMEHVTRCRFPASDAPAGVEPWFYWQGDEGGVKPEVFDVAYFIRSGR